MFPNARALCTLLTLCVLLISLTAEAALNAPAFQQTGYFAIEVAADGPGAAPNLTGTLNLAQLPGSAVPVKAFLYAMDTNHPGGVSGTFNNNPLPQVPSYATDSAFNTLYTFRWDVTNLILPGVTSYGYQLMETPDQFMNIGGQLGVAALVVVYSDPSITSKSVATIVDGMAYVGNPHGETESINITGLPVGSGTSAIDTVTYLDDNFGTLPVNPSGEQVRFNGVSIGGPLDGNLALNGSLNNWTGATIAGLDSMSITTNDDEFGWVLTTILTPIPLPGALWLMVPCLAVIRRCVSRTGAGAPAVRSFF